MFYDEEQFLPGFWPFLYSSSEECLFRSFDYVLIGLFAFSLLSCDSLYLLDTNHLSDK